jgi:lipopolysaccharide/colanic/teichoic acid biosynthesis glycosyltransferase
LVKVFAILLDTRPEYVARESGTGSLLMAPLGPVSVLRYLAARLAVLDHASLAVAPDFEPDAEYHRRLAAAGIRPELVLPAGELLSRIADYEPSDWLVVVDPRCVPARGFMRGALALDNDGPRRARHLVVLEAHPGGTTERVQLGANGTVGRIQRYYDSATWPFAAGVASSLLPVSCTLGAGTLALGSLRELRSSLAQRGILGYDVFLHGGAFDLSQERDLLGLSEQVTLDFFSTRRGPGRGWMEVGSGCRVEASARLVGPVVLQDGAVVEDDAVVVGPAVIGPGARVERSALVAQCVLGPEAVVTSGLTVVHRAVFGAVTESLPPVVPATPYETVADPALEPAQKTGGWGRVSTVYPKVKAAIDVTAAAVGLLLLSPLLLLVALLIKLESKGPVFYRDRREGKGGRVFKCIKFRTMLAGADAQQRELYAQNQVDGPQFKLARDPRVTRLGRVLRALSIDELPQLFNVLCLQMSLVGPRPSPFRENQLCVPWRDGRLSVRPGITGLWQVCRHDRSQGDFHQWIHFDLLYVRHLSFVVDLKILAATVITLAGQWPVPLSWIVSSRRLEGVRRGNVTTKVRAHALTDEPHIAADTPHIAADEEPGAVRCLGPS